jgi:ribosomal protein S1
VSVGDVVAVTVLAVDTAQRRISLSMVEAERQAREAEQAGARNEEKVVLGHMNEQRSLGTFADLLAASKRGNR